MHCAALARPRLLCLALLSSALGACGAEVAPADDAPSATAELRVWSSEPLLESAATVAAARLERASGLEVDVVDATDDATPIVFGSAVDGAIGVPLDAPRANLPDVVIDAIMVEFGAPSEGPLQFGQGAAKITAARLDRLCAVAPCLWFRPE